MAYLNPKTGQTIGYQETHGTTAEPYVAGMLWQTSTLSYVPMLADASGNLLTSGGGGGGGSNAAAGPTGSAPPSSADYIGINVGGVLQGVSSTYPLPVSAYGTVTVTGTLSGATASESPTGAAVPADGNYIAFNSAGNLVGVSSANPLPCTFTGSAGNAAAGLTGSAVPTSADYQGWNNGTSLVGNSLTTPMPIQPAATNFNLSVGNSSTTQLAAGATFTGTIESTISQQAVTVLVNCDQPSTVTFNQYITTAAGTVCESASVPLPAGAGMCVGFQVAGNDFSLNLTNNGSATTTTLNINTYYGTLPSVGVLPPSLSAPVVNANMYMPIAITSGSGLQQITNISYSTLGVQITSLGVGGAVSFYGSNDGINWAPMYGISPILGGQPMAPITSTTATGAWWFDIAGVQFFKVQATALTSGTITGAMYGSVAAGNINIEGVGVAFYNSTNNAVGGNLQVDTTSAGTDGSAYTANNFPQVDMVAGRGIDGNAHSIQTDQQGVVNTVDQNSQLHISLLQQILTELKILNAQTNVGLNVKDDVDNMRNEPYFTTYQ